MKFFDRIHDRITIYGEAKILEVTMEQVNEAKDLGVNWDLYEAAIRDKFDKIRAGKKRTAKYATDELLEKIIRQSWTYWEMDL